LELHGPYILHLATHGFFEPEDSSSENPNQSQTPGIKSDLTKSRFFKNPMHRSGLALAGANTTIAAWKRGEAPSIEEDGILTAEDVSTLDLKGTWLARFLHHVMACAKERHGWSHCKVFCPKAG
jgi:hypothetical protein